MFRIGTTRRGYVAHNVVDGARHPAIRFRRVPHLPLRALTRDPFFGSTTAVFAPSSVDLVHLYNEVGWCSRPFVVSFEDDLPRGRKRRRAFAAGLRAVASSRCRLLLAISECARRRLAADPRTGPVLGPKCVTVLPAVPRDDAAYVRHLDRLDDPAARAGPLECLFVGVQLHRKGGEFVLDALEPTLRAGAVRLTIVSSLDLDGYATPFDATRVGATRARIAALPGVRLVERLEPAVVRDAMARADLLLFPTLDETFGFVAVEALATGLDLVTTDVRALPEILPAGPLAAAARLDLDDGVWRGVRLWRREGLTAWTAAYERARDVAVAAIRARVEGALSDRGALLPRARTLRACYLERFTPEALGERLVAAYRRALGRG